MRSLLRLNQLSAWSAAIMRIGLIEMKRFSQEFFEGVKDDTFVSEVRSVLFRGLFHIGLTSGGQSCGVADLVTTCIGGRNRKCAEAFVKTKKVRLSPLTRITGSRRG